MIGRYVGRARGRALRAAGVPRAATPNLPSGRALAQRELRNAARVGVQRPRRGRRSSSDVPAADGPAVRRPTADGTSGGTSGSPYDDPSRDVGEGPDQFTRAQSLVWLAGFLVAVYLFSATCGTAHVPPPSDDPYRHCHVNCEEEP